MVDSKQQWKAWLYLAPAIVLLLVFTVWPIINTVSMAFQNDYSALLAKRGVTFAIGINNFRSVLAYGGFMKNLANTMILCVATVPLSTFLALLIAVALNSIKFLRKAIQTVFFLPYVTNSIAIGMVFAAMFNIIGLRPGAPVTDADSIGIVNYVFQFLHDAPYDVVDYIFGIFKAEPWGWLLWLIGFVMDPVQWANLVFGIFGAEPWDWLVDILSLLRLEPKIWINQGSSYWANMAVMIVYIVWNALPFKILVLLGGLQSVNRQYYDAAKVDGTPRSRVFTRITVPLLSPMIAYVVITGFIGGFKEYSSIVGIFGDTMGPASEPGRLNTMVGYIYDSLATSSHGKASAAALILFGIIMVVTVINLQVSKKKVHY